MKTTYKIRKWAMDHGMEEYVADNYIKSLLEILKGLPDPTVFNMATMLRSHSRTSRAGNPNQFKKELKMKVKRKLSS